MPFSVETPGTNRGEMPSEEEGPRRTEPSATSTSQPKTGRSAPATVADVPWLADVEQMRRRVLAEAESLRGEARGHYENLSAQAREKLEEAVWEASSLAGLQSQSAETLSLLARDNIGRKFKGSAEEVARLLDAAPGPGLRYRAAFSVAYGGGLRASEVTHLKVGDIDSDRMLIRVEQGKGRKDRHVMLSPSLLDLLRAWWCEARPAGWLFPGRNRVDPISTRQFNRAFGVARDFASTASLLPALEDAGMAA